jgi:hypothetical protein
MFGLQTPCARYWDKPLPPQCRTSRRLVYVYVIFFAIVSLVLQVVIFKNTTAETSGEGNEPRSGRKEAARFMFTTMLIQLDYLGDAFYMGRSTFATPLLYVLGLAAFFSPFVIFVCQFPAVVRAHWRCLFTHPAFHFVDCAYKAIEELRTGCHFERWNEMHKAVLHILGETVAGVAFLVVSIPNMLAFVVVFFFWSILIYVFVEWKLVSIPSFSIAVLTFGEPSLAESEEDSYFDETRLSYIFNSTTVLRMVLSTLPHLAVVTTNTILLYAQDKRGLNLE